MQECFSTPRDPLRINIAADGMGGFDLATWLWEEHSLAVELTNSKVVVLALGRGSTCSHAATLCDVLQQLDTMISGKMGSSL